MLIMENKTININGDKCRIALSTSKEILKEDYLHTPDKKYIFQVTLPKSFNLDNFDELLHETFTLLINNKYKDMGVYGVYIPKEHTILEIDDTYMDVFYDLKYIHNLDNKYITDDGEVGKNILSFDKLSTTNSTISFKLEVTSLIVIDENNLYQSLLSFKDYTVTKFLKRVVADYLNALH